MEGRLNSLDITEGTLEVLDVETSRCQECLTRRYSLDRVGGLLQHCRAPRKGQHIHCNFHGFARSATLARRNAIYF